MAYVSRKGDESERRQRSLTWGISVIFILSVLLLGLVGCGPSHDSLQTCSEDAWEHRVGRNFRDVGHGYQWWSVRAGDHRYNLAWGHGGQQIVVLDELGMVIVVADPLYGETEDGPWNREKANLNLVANFIASLPGE